MGRKREFDFDIERILDDAEWCQLEALVQADLHGIYGEAHDRWIRRAHRQVQIGEKLAYGVWKRDPYGAVEPELVGACIFHNPMSGTRQDDTLEIKLVYVKKEYRNPANGGETRDERLHLGRRLLEKVIEVGQRHEYDAVVADAKTDVQSVSFFFLKNGFHITALNFQFSWPSYEFGFRIRPVYRQDPRDARMVVEWLCRLWGVRVTPTEDPRILDASYPLHSRKQFFPDETYAAGPTIPLKIAIAENVDDDVLESVSAPRLVFLRDDAKKPADNDGTAYIGLADVRSLTENRAISFMPVGTALDIAVSVRADFFDRFNTGKDGVFLDGGCYGLLLGGDEPSRIFFFDAASPRSNARLLGFAEVSRVETGHPHSLWDKYSELSAFDEDRFAQYANIKTKMTAIVFSELTKVRANRTGAELPEGGWSYVDRDDAYDLLSAAQKALGTLQPALEK